VSLSAGREHPAVLSAAVGRDRSRQRIVMVGRRRLQRRAFLSLSGDRNFGVTDRGVHRLMRTHPRLFLGEERRSGEEEGWQNKDG
jgi:hypothetical protein